MAIPANMLTKHRMPSPSEVLKNCNFLLRRWDRNLAETMILCSRTNEFICGKIEKECVIGYGAYNNGTWFLNCGFMFHPDVPYNYAWPLNSQPLIEQKTASSSQTTPSLYNKDNMEVAASTLIANAFPEWQTTPFSYLRAAAGDPGLNPWVTLSPQEIEEARHIASRVKFNGLWTGKNQCNTSLWSDSLSVPQYSPLFIIRDATGTIRYGCDMLMNTTPALVPVVYLKRAGFPAPRRAFLPPEPPYTLYDAYTVAHSNSRNVFLCDQPDLVLANNLISSIPFAAIMGDHSSIPATDTTPLCGKIVWWLLFSEDAYDIETALKVSALMKSKSIACRILRVYGNRGFQDWQGLLSLTNVTPKELRLEDVVTAARKRAINIPEILNRSYYGDVTEQVKTSAGTLIPSALEQDGALLTTVDSTSPTGWFARFFAEYLNGERTVEGWQDSSGGVAIIIDPEQQCAISDIVGGSVRACDTRFMAQPPETRMGFFENAIGNAKFVVFLSRDFVRSPGLAAAVLRWCQTHHRTAVVITGDSSGRPLREEFSFAHTVKCRTLLNDNRNVELALEGEVGFIALKLIVDPATGDISNTEPLQDHERQESNASPATHPSRPFTPETIKEFDLF